MDFVHDQLATGPKLRILTVVDTFSRFSPAVVPRFNLRAADVVEVLERICCEGGYLAAIRVDQGSEFISRELDLWAYMKGVTLDFSRPGNPRTTRLTSPNVSSPNAKLCVMGVSIHNLIKINIRSHRHDAAWVQPRVTAVIVPLDVDEVDRRPDVGVLVKGARVIP